MAKSNNVERNGFTSGQMEALNALCDTVWPSIDFPPNQFDDQSIGQFYKTSASMAKTPNLVAEFVGVKVQHPKIYLAILALRLLSTRLGTLILCGKKSLSPNFPYLQIFSKISSEKRQQILLSWSRSHFLLLRILYTAIKIFTLLVFFTQVDEKNENLSWKAIGYPGPDPTRKLDSYKLQCSEANGKHQKQDDDDDDDDARKEDLFGPLHKGIINLNQGKETSLKKLQNLGFPISIPQSKSTRARSLNPSFIVKCDAVVVGSGSGGGVIAGVLAKAGYKVIVLEKGSYLARTKLSLLEGDSLDQMYLEGGMLGTNNMDVLVLAGSTVGGGSTINWSACIQTPPHVRKEWSENYGLELFESEAYEHALDVVSKKMGIQLELDQEGFNNMILRKGCEDLGYHVETIARNTTSDHYCGWCCFGCKDGRKKGTSETWLADLVESRNGVILPECEALKVITEKDKGGRRAIGVAFEFQTNEGKEIAIVEAKVTVTACGAICTPGLLKRSGLKNPNIGKNLHVHPVVMAWGYFPELSSWPESDKKSYQGGIITAMSKVDHTCDYGAIIQTPSLHPGLFSILMPWISGSDMKNRMLKFSRTAHLFALARDKGSGLITSETDISYRVEDHDQESLSKGMERALRILAAAGAEEIGTHHNTGRVLKVKEASEEELEKFVKEESSRPLKKLSSPICSAHQMGSCRMGVDPKGSAVNEKGETWEVKGLFVGDSSVFPSALGVNPMVTIQAIAYCTAQSVVQVLGRRAV